MEESELPQSPLPPALPPFRSSGLEVHNMRGTPFSTDDDDGSRTGKRRRWGRNMLGGYWTSPF